MNIHNTKCCGIQEIDKLGQHKSAEEAMVSFCKQQLHQALKFGSCTARSGSLFSFYMFTAAVYEKGSTDEYGVVITDGFAHKYGVQFAKFIKENKLGKVWASPAKKNTVFHPNHANQIYIWNADQPALEAWWNDWQAKNPFNTPLPKTVVKEVEPTVLAPPPLLVSECGCGADLDCNGLCTEGCNEDYYEEEDE